MEVKMSKKTCTTLFRYSKSLDEKITFLIKKELSPEEKMIVSDLGYNFSQGKERIPSHNYPNLIKEMIPDLCTNKILHYDFVKEEFYLELEDILSLLILNNKFIDWKIGLHDWDDPVPFKTIRNLLVCGYARYEQTKPSGERMRSRECAAYSEMSTPSWHKNLKRHKIKWKNPIVYHTQKNKNDNFLN